MSLRSILTAVAEGVANDARGQITLVAAEPSVWQPSELPGQMNFFYAVVLEDDDPVTPTLVQGESAFYSMRVVDPDGSVLALWDQTIITPAPVDPALPARVQLVMPIPLVVQREGTHTITLVTRFAAGEYRWSRDFRVRLAPS